jgi:pyrroloquinoline quinone biosynthesis protein B
MIAFTIQSKNSIPETAGKPSLDSVPFIQILGVAQDGGYPHIGCSKICCQKAWKNKEETYVVSFALVDPLNKKWWLFEATPDIKKQLHYFQELTNAAYAYLPEGVFLTHAHIGHYTGLMEFGREAMSTKSVPVFALPKMANFLKTNGPWSQLVTLNNIAINQLDEGKDVALTDQIHVTAFTVPHRDEFSETAGFRININKKSYLFIPDIDKWEKWKLDIKEEVAKVDVALIDATFFSMDELPNRKIQEVPHPLIEETVGLFQNTNQSIKSKIYFIHFNHTNPVLWNGDKKKELQTKGFNIAEQGKKL